MTQSFRNKLLWLHTWVGIVTAAAMLLFALTGAVLVMRQHIDPLLDRQLRQAPSCAQPLPLDRIERIARAAAPRTPPKSIDIELAGNSSIAVALRNQDYVYVAPCTGRVLGIQNEYGGLTGTLDGLHRFRFMASGRLVAGWFNAAILLALIIGGTILWWPRSRAALKAGLKFDVRLPGIARTLSLHRFLGIYGAALLLLLTVTGMPISFVWAKNVIGWATQSSVKSPSMPANLSHAGPPVSLEAIRRTVLREMPGASWISIGVPAQPYQPVRVEVLDRGAPHPDAKSYLYLDSVTGRVVKRLDYARDIPLGRKAYLFTIAIHSGLVGGLFYQLVLMLACLVVPVQVYSGISPYLRKRARRSVARGLRLQLVARREEAEGIASFEFADPRGRPLPAFSAGSHIDLRLAPGLVRQYSLCNSPFERHRYVIAVQRAEPSRGGSAMLHDQLEIGALVDASSPRNHFPLAHDAAHSLLIAGGIGVTPILCMAERLEAMGAALDCHYCVGSRVRAAFWSRIAESPLAKHATLHVSDENDRLDIAALLRGTPHTSHIYVCGPNRLNDAVVTEALAQGWDEAHIHREYFAAAAMDSSHDRAFDVKIASTGAVLHVPVGQSIVEVLAQEGIDIATSCSEGVCGTCITRVLAGEIDHRDLVLSPEDHARQDRMTPCCSRALAEMLVLDL